MARLLDRFRFCRFADRSRCLSKIAFRPVTEGLEMRLSPSSIAPEASPAPAAGRPVTVPHIEPLKMAPA